MSVAIDSWADAWRPQDRRSRCEWGEQYVRVPGSARANHFDVSQTPWLREPIDFSADNRVREQVLMMPTGAGKTSVFDVVIPHAIAEDPGDALLGIQGNNDAKQHFDSRLLPTLRNVPEIAMMMSAMDRHKIRKDAIIFPHMTLYMGGVNMTNAQRKSVRYVLIDEAWQAEPHGVIEEFRARHHDRWNARVIIVSQGGETHLETGEGMIETELESAWQRTDRREWCFQCPECGAVQRYSQKRLLYERAETSDGSLDETAVTQSARYQCEGRCETEFPDTIHVRRQLANSGRYVVQNPRHLARHHGWHCNALTLYYVPWGQLAVEHAKAHRARKTGDDTGLRIYRQKRLAENNRKEEAIQQTALNLGDYSLEDYIDGQKWEGEVMRCFNIDVQRDHYFATARAWRADGSSRRLYAGKINTDEQLRDTQTRLKIEDKWVSIDSGHFTDRVYNLAARFGWRAFKGDDAEFYKFMPPRGKPFYKFYSPIKHVVGSGGKPCGLILFSNLQCKRILERLRNGPQKLDDSTSTDVPSWEVEGDITDEFQKHLFSEMERDTRSKITGKYSRAFVPIGNRANHTWDTEVAAIVFALAANVLAYHPEQKAE